MEERTGDAADGAAGGLNFRVLEPRTFWVSYLSHNGKDDRQILRGVRETIRSLAIGRVWGTSTLRIFESHATIDHIALMLRFDRKVRDVLLIGSFTHAECRVVGQCEDPAIFDLVPFARPAEPAEIRPRRRKRHQPRTTAGCAKARVPGELAAERA
jgi:hypothetical protein